MPLDLNDVTRLRDIVLFGAKVATIIKGVTLAQLIDDNKILFATCYGI